MRIFEEILFLKVTHSTKPIQKKKRKEKKKTHLLPLGFLRKEEGMRLTYLSKGPDVRSMTHKIKGVKIKK